MPETIRPTTPKEAVEALAQRMYEYSEHLDPTPDNPDTWQELPETSKEFWRCVVDDLIGYEDWIKLAQSAELGAGR
jgi:hypothetical protein